MNLLCSSFPKVPMPIKATKYSNFMKWHDATHRWTRWCPRLVWDAKKFFLFRENRLRYLVSIIASFAASRIPMIFKGLEGGSVIRGRLQQSHHVNFPKISLWWLKILNLSSEIKWFTTHKNNETMKCERIKYCEKFLQSWLWSSGLYLRKEKGKFSPNSGKTWIERTQWRICGREIKKVW